jgi:hypothetical protein
MNVKNMTPCESKRMREYERNWGIWKNAKDMSYAEEYKRMWKNMKDVKSIKECCAD